MDEKINRRVDRVNLFVAVTQSCPILCDPMDCSTPGFPVLHHLLELAQPHVQWVNDAIQPSCPLSSPSPALNLYQHQSLFQWVGSLHEVAKVLELQLQYISLSNEYSEWIYTFLWSSLTNSSSSHCPSCQLTLKWAILSGNSHLMKNRV